MAKTTEPASTNGTPTANCNIAVLRGVVRRPPEWRTLPSGDELVQLEVRVERPGAPADTVPVELLHPPKSIARLRVDEPVVVVGRVQRRFFRAAGALASRTAVAATAVVAATQRRRVARVLEAAVAALDPELDKAGDSARQDGGIGR
ncbi:MAG: hypothetical protein HKN26_10090 [Acidimicrobiales bacterium]|nr:hypothetical protein [Acidimicrobiales bacterium]